MVCLYRVYTKVACLWVACLWDACLQPGCLWVIYLWVACLWVTCLWVTCLCVACLFVPCLWVGCLLLAWLLYCLWLGVYVVCTYVVRDAVVRRRLGDGGGWQRLLGIIPGSKSTTQHCQGLHIVDTAVVVHSETTAKHCYRTATISSWQSPVSAPKQQQNDTKSWYKATTISNCQQVAISSV